MSKRIAEGMTFDDVLLVPRKSEVFSRKDVSVATRLSKHILLNIPIVSANMDTVTEAKMARAMAEAGGIGIIHRFLSIERQIEEVQKVKRAENAVIEHPITVCPNDTLSDVRALLEREGISGALVVQGWGAKKTLVGIVTSRDLMFEEESHKRVKDIMTKRVITASPSVTPDKARDIMHKHKIEKLPLVRANGALAGLMTLKDIIKKIKNPNAAKDAKGKLLVGAAIGVKEDSLRRAKLLREAGADAIVVDVAHGHNIRAIDTVRALRRTFGRDVEIVVGNIATAHAAKDLIRVGADGLKVGIGPGAACTTRIVAGVGVPQISAIMDVVRVARRHDVPVIADGGVRSSGDVAKALAAGASSVMVGNLLAGCTESPGEYVIERGMAYKYYRGMASYEASSAKRSIDGAPDAARPSPEGASGRIPFKGDAAMALFDLVSGLRSSMSYLGAHTLSELYKNAEFIRMSPAGLAESHPHGIRKV